MFLESEGGGLEESVRIAEQHWKCIYEAIGLEKYRWRRRRRNKVDFR